eukprot:scaffold32435_cov22-Prasinocladus_malaysianus.AAC.1
MLNPYKPMKRVGVPYPQRPAGDSLNATIDVPLVICSSTTNTALLSFNSDFFENHRMCRLTSRRQ